jgi:flagellar motor protein MotB
LETQLDFLEKDWYAMMKRNKKRFLALLLCLTMVLSLMPTAAFATEDETAGSSDTEQISDEQGTPSDDNDQVPPNDYQNPDETNADNDVSDDDIDLPPETTEEDFDTLNPEDESLDSDDSDADTGKLAEESGKDESTEAAEDAVVVAKIGDKVYTLLQDAVDNGGTVELQTDVTLISALKISKGTTVTIDLNGHTIKYAGEVTISNKGTLTVQDKSGGSAGKIVGKSCVNNYGSLEIQSGNIQSTSARGIWNCADNAIVTVSGGSVVGATYGMCTAIW